ncbi:MAG: archaeal proteasome endopeptidase complex subunit beta [Candidatus Methanomethylicaceae archaeon]|nr:archaeal proteasome endopeptidase complex subunit beta [Candidatus Verstraetearchaeota archaeon]
MGFPITGATTIGILCKNGVVLASEKRISYGYSLMSKAGKKVFLINNRIGVAFAGLISDAQAVLRRLAMEIRLYELEKDTKMSVRAAAKFLANLLYSQRFFPVFTETIIGGFDEEGFKLFILDQLGSLIEDKYAAVGTGAALAISIIEGSYKEDMTIEEARDLAIKSMKAAISRDVVSGDGIDLVIISNNESKEEFIPIR